MGAMKREQKITLGEMRSTDEFADLLRRLQMRALDSHERRSLAG
jgi:hypothetical protein